MSIFNSSFVNILGVFSLVFPKMIFGVHMIGVYTIYLFFTCTCIQEDFLATYLYVYQFNQR